jgi:hypothetical protein
VADPLSYVYAITRRPDAGVVRDLRGIAGAEVRWVEGGDIAAVVSSVDADEFGEEGLRRNLENLKWLESTVRDHNRVVESVATAMAVAPMGLATAYFSDDRVREMLTERAGTFADVLDRVTGRTEWGVKGYADLGAELTEDEPESVSSESPGVAYLRRVRERRSSRERAEQQALHEAGEVHETLAELSEASRIHPPQSRELAGYEGVMVLNGAYLVNDGRNDEFVGAVRSLAERHPALRLELTGPWPAYSFATIRAEEAS